MPDLDHMDALMPAADAAAPDARDHEVHEDTMLTMHSTMAGLQDQMAATQKNATAMGHAFDASKNDDSFYLPPESSTTPTSIVA